jgi:uncharacterized protein YlxP (DUF503 family)
MAAIGLLTVRVHIPLCNSLKAKRMVIKSLKERLTNKFNISVAESGNHDKWQLSDIAVANVSTDKAHVDSALSNVLNYIENFHEVDVVDHRIELF